MECLSASKQHSSPLSGPLNLQLVGETPAVAFNWVGDVTKLSSGLCVCVCVCVRALTRMCVEDEGVSVCRRQRVRAQLSSAQDARRIRVFRWVDRTFALESKRFGNVDCVWTSHILKKKLEVLESESALVRV